jgi:hypothetical protein
MAAGGRGNQTLDEYLAEATEAGEAEENGRSRSPRVARSFWNSWALGAAGARGGTVHVEICRGAPVPLYVGEEWLRAYPSRFTPFLDSVLAQDFAQLKMSVVLYSREVIELLQCLDAWAVRQVAARSEELLGVAVTAERLGERFRSTLYKKGQYAPVVDVRLLLERAPTPTRFEFDGEAQRSAKEALRELRDAHPTWQAWLCTPVRVEATPARVWIRSDAMGVEMVAARVCVRGVAK